MSAMSYLHTQLFRDAADHLRTLSFVMQQTRGKHFRDREDMETYAVERVIALHGPLTAQEREAFEFWTRRAVASIWTALEGFGAVATLPLTSASRRPGDALA